MDQRDRNLKTYDAIISTTDPAGPGQRVSVLAENLKEAIKKLEAEYGEENVYYVNNEEESNRPR